MDLQGQGRQEGRVRRSGLHRRGRERVPARPRDPVDGRRRRRRGSADQALPGGVPRPAGMQLRPGLPQPVEPRRAGQAAGSERLAEEGQAVGRRARARGGAGLRGGAAQAFGSGVGDQQPGAPGAGPGPAARPGRIRAGGRPLRPRLQRPPDRADPARAQADAAATQANAAGTRTGAGRAQADAAGMRATAAANPTTARRLSGASPGNRTEGGRRRSLRRRHEKPRKTRKFWPPGAEPALLPREKALRKPPGKPVVRENRRLFCQTLVMCGRQR